MTTNRSQRELAILHAIAEALNREVDLDSALHVALARVLELFNLKTGWIFLMDQETSEMYLAAYQNLPPGLKSEPERMQGTCYCLDTYRDGSMGGAANVSIITCTRLKNLLAGTDGLRFHASIPLYERGKKLGILNVVSRDWQELSEDDLHLLYTVGELVSMAIQRARLFSRSIELGALHERNRLAREIHDTLAQGLTAITLKLETADVLLDDAQDLARIQTVVQDALRLTRQNLEEARRSVMDLRAAPLEGRTLAEALSALVVDVNARGDITVSFSGPNRSLPSRIASGLYRIAQQALNNVVQHSGADEASISLEITTEEIYLVIEDNGRGFELSSLPEDRFGLIGLQERAKMLGGSLRLQTAPDEGTRVEVSVPFTGLRSR
ncbi:MAG: GAF domain-containing sensor histidine kinase [Chloroflexi bacterium]|nr:GAF domain-containing sensor histidine kinase [Chloroflexota bacterium]